MRRRAPLMLRPLALALIVTSGWCLIMQFDPPTNTYRLIPLGRWELRGDDRLFLSWDPAQPYRPKWAGQMNRHGFRYTRWSNGSAEVGAPMWVIATSLAFGAAFIGSVCFRMRRGRGPGKCPHCGYDFRATPDRCPECGTIPNDTTPKTPTSSFN